MEPKHATKDTNLNFQPIALEHVPVVQIWIMHINALKTQLMYKNVQTNPEKNPKTNTTLMLFYMLSLEKNEIKKR